MDQTLIDVIKTTGFASSLLGGFLGAIFGNVIYYAAMDVGVSLLNLVRRAMGKPASAG